MCNFLKKYVYCGVEVLGYVVDIDFYVFMFDEFIVYYKVNG